MFYNQTKHSKKKPKIQLKDGFSRGRIKEISGRIYRLKTLKADSKFRKNKVYIFPPVTRKGQYK